MPLNKIGLCGLDGGNLPAFMAALETLRVMSDRERDVRLSWTDAPGWWMPAAEGVKQTARLFGLCLTLAHKFGRSAALVGA